jgi:hypothetical protein
VPVLLNESCGARGGVVSSSLVFAGRGGMPQDADADVPGLYIADRPVGDAPDGGSAAISPTAPMPLASAPLSLAAAKCL